MRQDRGMDDAATGTLHHVELWVPDFGRATASWGWLLTALGYEVSQDFTDGRSYSLDHTYVVIEQSPALTAGQHERCRPGLNHLAFHVATRAGLDELTAGAQQHGWSLMFADRHPHAGGDGTYAAYLEDEDGFEAELVGPGDAG
jgi:catechol 2,3-dioxygenase-like lactoylglutathione lyase family enzyme